MAKSHLKLVSPATANRTVTPLRRPNAEIRPREHLTEREVEKLIETAKRNRWGQRDATMILVAFRHGLRASELCRLQWSDIEFAGTLHLRRSKGGTTATHPLQGDELRALRALKRGAKSPFVFVSDSRPRALPSWSNRLASRPSCHSLADKCVAVGTDGVVEFRPCPSAAGFFALVQPGLYCCVAALLCG
jgi:integrase